MWQYIDSLLELYPVKGLFSTSNNLEFLDELITLKSTGYIKVGDGEHEFVIDSGTNLLVLKPANSNITLDKTSLSFKKSEYSDNIEYATLRTRFKEKLSVDGKFFVIADEMDNPLYVTYSPVVKNILPTITIETKGNQNIRYNMFIKEYTVSGTFVKDITLSGEIANGSSILLPLYDDALYNIHIKAFYSDKERDLVFTMIKETDTGNSTYRENHQKFAEIQRVENSDIYMPQVVDILGRKTFPKTGGIFFKQEGNHKRPIILIK